MQRYIIIIVAAILLANFSYGQAVLTSGSNDFTCNTTVWPLNSLRLTINGNNAQLAMLTSGGLDSDPVVVRMQNYHNFVLNGDTAANVGAITTFFNSYMVGGAGSTPNLNQVLLTGNTTPSPIQFLGSNGYIGFWDDVYDNNYGYLYGSGVKNIIAYMPSTSGTLITNNDLLNADWDAISGITQINNKPIINTIQLNGNGTKTLTFSVGLTATMVMVFSNTPLTTGVVTGASVSGSTVTVTTANTTTVGVNNITLTYWAK